jgi:uncharacterized protein YbjT (DUF2867 family)
MAGPRLVLLTGATGYVGGRLLRALEERGERVRCLSRRPGVLAGRVGARTEVVGGDVRRPETLTSAFDGVDTAYYLVHSMTAATPFVAADRSAAEVFAAAAHAAGVRRIVYLGGLGSGRLSPHLASRQEVGRVLRDSGVPTVEFRASIVLGSGSASFDMLRALVERLPVMITPRWVTSRSQPIAIEDVLAYLLAALDLDGDRSVVYEIGGANAVTYRELMLEYARQRGLRRLLLPVPFLSPRLSSLWLTLVTPVHAGIGRDLVESLRNDTVVHDTSALQDFGVRPRTVAEAVARALQNEDRAIAETRWSDEAVAPEQPFGGRRFGSRLVDVRARTIPRPPAIAFAPVQRIGGSVGWYYARPLWGMRGLLDALVGGPGLRRGRRDPVGIRVGDTIDFWRVERFEPDSVLRLRAEMRLPGRAWLQFEVAPAQGGGSILTQTAIFDPAGLAGLAYWYGLWPVHRVIFEGMARRIAAAAAGDAAVPLASVAR